MSPLVFFAFIVTFMEKTLPMIKFYGVFNHFSQTSEVNLQSLERLNCITAQVTSYTLMNNQNMLLWLTCKLLEFFVNAILFYDEKGSF